MSNLNDTPKTVTIQLTKGYSTIVDESDSDLATKKWCVIIPKKSPYAIRRINVDKQAKYLYLHRIILSRILGRELLPTEHVDHKDGNGLNNCRANLRLATLQQNNQNVGIRSHNKSGYKGVYWNKRRQRWIAIIRANHKVKHLGYFKTPQAAHQAYCEAAKRLHGEFARFE